MVNDFMLSSNCIIIVYFYVFNWAFPCIPNKWIDQILVSTDLSFSSFFAWKGQTTIKFYELDVKTMSHTSIDFCVSPLLFCNFLSSSFAAASCYAAIIVLRPTRRKRLCLCFDSHSYRTLNIFMPLAIKCRICPRKIKQQKENTNKPTLTHIIRIAHTYQNCYLPTASNWNKKIK